MMKLALTVAVAAIMVMCAMSASVSEQEIDEYNIFTKLKSFIKHFGHEAVSFITCMGPKAIEDCGSQILSCVAGVALHNPKACISALKCEGKDAVVCAHHLKDK